MAFRKFINLLRYIGIFDLEGRVRFREEAAAPSKIINSAQLYSRDKAGISTLFWLDDKGVEHDLSALVTNDLSSLFGRGGDDGEQGEMGPPGIKGADGAPGATGSQGLAGTIGLDGQDGEPGEMGPPGLAGSTGAAGAAGAAGIQGLMGPPGLDAEEPEFPMIIPGPAGADGGSGSQATILKLVSLRG